MLFRYFSTIDSRKLFESIWGTDGLDSNDELIYIAYTVSGNYKYNGTYAYSVMLDRWVKLDI